MADTSSSLNLIQNKVKLFYNRYYQEPVEYKAEEVDAVITYFKKRGFDEIAAVNTGVILLQQAKTDEMPVFKLIDTLKGLTDVQLSNVVAQILNLNRSKSSTLGYRITPKDTLFDQRNILT